MGLSDGITWEKEYGWMNETTKYFTCRVVVTEIREMVLPAKSKEEYLEKVEKMGHKIAPLSAPYETKEPFKARY